MENHHILSFRTRNHTAEIRINALAVHVNLSIPAALQATTIRALKNVFNRPHSPKIHSIRRFTACLNK